MLLTKIAERIGPVSYADAPASAQEMARAAVLDTVGVTLAGARSDAVLAVTQAHALAMAGGAATLFGAARQVDPLSAALVNGTAAHAHDFDDCSNTMGGHPSAPVLAAIWGLAEARSASGATLLSAYVAGVECETRFGRAVNFHHYEKGWHPTATLGTFGAAAAAAHLIGLDTDRTATALALAASMASGIKANFGTMAKPLHVGLAARDGLSAALLAEAGMTANAEALEHKQGFFAVYDEGEVDADACLRGWADPLDLVAPGIAFKRHPCCASTHPAIDALLALRDEHGLTWEDVAHVRSWTHPRRLRHTDRPDPASDLDAKFSVQYVLAQALEKGRIELTDFEGGRHADPAVRERMARITAEPHPEADMANTDHFYAEVTVTLRDGTELIRRVERPLGRDRDHPLPPGALERKFLDCAGLILPERDARALFDALETVPSLDRVSDLSGLLSGPVSEMGTEERVA